MYREKLVHRQLFFLLFIMRTTIVISFLPVLTLGEARQDAWIAAILTFFTSAAAVYFVVKLALKFPNKSIVEYSQELIGIIPGKLLCLSYLGLFLFVAGTDIRLYGEVIRSGFLPEMPMVVIVGSMVLLAVMAVYSGLEPLGRMADIIFPIFLLMLLGALLFPLLEADFSNLQPVLYNGWSPVLMAVITPTAIIAQYTTLSMLVPSLTQPEKTMKVALWSLFCSSLVLVFFALIVVAVLGAEEGMRATFPVFKMLRAVRISAFLERIEVLSIFPWGLGAFSTVSIILYSGAKGLSQVLGMQDYRPLVFPMGVIWVTLALQIHRDYFEIRAFSLPENIGPFTAVLYFLLPTVLWIACLLKRGHLNNRGDSKAEK